MPWRRPARGTHNEGAQRKRKGANTTATQRPPKQHPARTWTPQASHTSRRRPKATFAKSPPPPEKAEPRGLPRVALPHGGDEGADKQWKPRSTLLRAASFAPRRCDARAKGTPRRARIGTEGARQTDTRNGRELDLLSRRRATRVDAGGTQLVEVAAVCDSPERQTPTQETAVGNLMTLATQARPDHECAYMATQPHESARAGEDAGTECAACK